MAVDIGEEAIDRESAVVHSNTRILKGSPATASGEITSIEIWAYSDITGLRVGSFYLTGTNKLKCRDSEAIAGTITAGSKVTKAVSIAVEPGDYIGYYCSGGYIEYDNFGCSGNWYYVGEYIDPGDEATYNVDGATTGFSLGGYITVAAVGRSFGFIIG